MERVDSRADYIQGGSSAAPPRSPFASIRSRDASPKRSSPVSGRGVTFWDFRSCRPARGDTSVLVVPPVLVPSIQFKPCGWSLDQLWPLLRRHSRRLRSPRTRQSPSCMLRCCRMSCRLCLAVELLPLVRGGGRVRRGAGECGHSRGEEWSEARSSCIIAR